MIGEALAPLRKLGILIVGAGMSYHDVRAFNGQRDQDAEAFGAWLVQSVADPGARDNALID